ncbi:MAG: hypothetical protein QXT13_12770 [Pyrobaculum sp.]
MCEDYNGDIYNTSVTKPPLYTYALEKHSNSSHSGHTPRLLLNKGGEVAVVYRERLKNYRQRREAPAPTKNLLTLGIMKEAAPRPTL